MKSKCVAIIAVVFVVGCSKEIMPTSSEINPQEFLSLSPQDGETSVRLDSPIILSFAKPVDRAAVERGLHLISERAMADSVCPISPTMGHGDMDSMTDSSKMRHLDRYHSSTGRFVWNDDSTRCTFQPDSTMTEQTQYMIHLDGQMTQMVGQRMGNMSAMAGHGTGMMSGEMMFHFFTMDTNAAASGHSGHH